MIKKEKYQPHYKILLLGPAKSGKTQFINCFLNNNFSDTYYPTKTAQLYNMHLELTDQNHPKPEDCIIEFIDM